MKEIKNTVNIFETGIIGPCMSSKDYKPKKLKLVMDNKNNISKLMKANNYKNLEELMEKEINFNDKEFMEKLNSPEFQEKIKNINLKLSGE